MIVAPQSRGGEAQHKIEGGGKEETLPLTKKNFHNGWTNEF